MQLCCAINTAVFLVHLVAFVVLCSILVYSHPTTYVLINNQLIFIQVLLAPLTPLLQSYFSSSVGKLHFHFYLNSYRKYIVAPCTERTLLLYLSSYTRKQH